MVAKTVSFYPSWSHLPWSVIIWRMLRTRFSAPFELFSHLLWLLDVSLQLQKKSGMYLHVICLRMIRFQTFTLLLLHYYEYWLFNARHSINIQINMPAPLTQVEELWVLKHLGNIKGIFLIKAAPGEMVILSNSWLSKHSSQTQAVRVWKTCLGGWKYYSILFIRAKLKK